MLAAYRDAPPAHCALSAQHATFPRTTSDAVARHSPAAGGSQQPPPRRLLQCSLRTCSTGDDPWTEGLSEEERQAPSLLQRRESLVGTLPEVMLLVASDVAWRLQETLLPDVPAAVQRLHEALQQHRRDSGAAAQAGQHDPLIVIDGYHG